MLGRFRAHSVRWAGLHDSEAQILFQIYCDSGRLLTVAVQSVTDVDLPAASCKLHRHSCMMYRNQTLVYAFESIQQS